MSVPGGGGGAFQYSVTVNIQNVEAATQRLQQISKQTQDQLNKNLSIIARVDTSGFQQQLQKVEQTAKITAQQVDAAFANSGKSGVQSFQQVEQAAVSAAAGTAKAFTAAAQSSAQSFTRSYQSAFEQIQQQAQANSARFPTRTAAVMNPIDTNAIVRDAQNAASRASSAFSDAGRNSAKAWNDAYTSAFSNIQGRAARLNQQAAQARQAVSRPTNTGAGTGGVAAEEDNIGQTLLGGAARGALRGLGAGAGVPIGIGFTAAAGAAIALAAGVEAVVAAIKNGIAAAIEYNSQLQQSTITFTQLTGNVQDAANAIAGLKQYADITPFNTQEVLESGQAFIRVAQGSTEEMMRLVKAAGALATVNPEQGLKGATYAIRELLSGDVQSLADRFNVSRASIRAFMAEGLTGAPLIEAINTSLGVTAKTVEAMGQTFEGRKSTIAAFFANFNQQLSLDSFDNATSKLGELTKWLDTNGQAWLVLANRIGPAITAIGAVAVAGSGLGPIFAALSLANIPVQAAFKPDTSTPQAQAKNQELETAKAASQGIREELVKTQAAYDANKVAIEQSSAKLGEIKLRAAEITAEYERQLSPLQRQLELLQKPDFNRQRQAAGLSIQSAQLGQAERAAGPSVELRAQAAAANVTLTVQERLQQIENRRKEIAEQQVEAANRGKTVQEFLVKVLGDQVKEMQRVQQVAGEARAIRMEGLREEQQASQDVRSVRLEGIREEQRLSQQQRSDKRDAIHEEQQLQEENYQAATRASDRAHQATMQHFNDEIDKLRDKQTAMDRANRGTSPAEQALSNLDRNEQAFQNQKSLFEARRAVANAPVGQSRTTALENLRDLQHTQAVGAQRQRLQDQIKAEQQKEQEDRIKVEDRIAAIQKKAQSDDRSFQTQKQNIELAHEKTVEAQKIADRNQDKADKAQERSEQNALRAQESKDKAADRSEQAAIRKQEQADKQAERVEKQQLTKLQLQEEQARNTAEKERDAKELAKQIASDQRQAALDKLELVRMANEEVLLTHQDTTALAQLAASRVKLEDAQAQVGFETAIEEGYKKIAALNIQEQIFNIKQSEIDRLAAIKEMTTIYELQAQHLKVAGDNLKYMVDTLKEALKDADAFVSKIRSDIVNAYNSTTAKVAGSVEAANNWAIAGQNAVISWWNGWTRDPAVVKISADFVSAFQKLNDWFVQFGKNAMQSFINGWNIVKAGWNMLTGQQAQQPQQPVQQATASPTTAQQGGGGYTNNYGNGQQMLQAITGRAYGGSVFPGNIYKVNEDSQYMEVFTPGTVSPTGAAYAGGIFGGGGRGSGVSIGSIKIDIDASKTSDPHMVGQIVEAKVTAGINYAIQQIVQTDHVLSNPANERLPGVPIR